MAAAEAEPAGRVAVRRVFYVPGFDPSPPRRYREMYRTEAARQAEITGRAITMSARSASGAYGWRAEADEVLADFEVLVWSDIVRASMRTGIVATYLQLARVVWIYVGSGALVRLLRLRKGPMIAAIYPIVYLLAVLGLALGVGWLAAGLARPGGAGPEVAAFVAVVWAVLEASRRADGRVYAWYLMHDYAFTAEHRGANPAPLEARMAGFRARIATVLAAPCDEVLVVGHSSGVHIAVSVLADLIRAGEAPAGGPALGLLSLGQVVPMVSFLPEAHRLRADLGYLAACPHLTWVDVTAPGDGCAFALCDPVAVSGVAPPGKRWPLVLTAAFSQTLSPERWRRLRWRFLTLHFQYLCAFDRPDAYDYFAITAGPLTLAERFRGRSPAKGRIETPLNPHGRAR